MLSRTKLAIYFAFLVTLAIWFGSGVFDTILTHPAWSADPVTHVRRHWVDEGKLNPWPFTTMAVALCTLAGLAAFARHRGPGRREVLVVLAGIFVILVATGVYFVPTLIKLSNHEALSDGQIVSLSRTWIALNLFRIFMVGALFVYGLMGLMRLAEGRVLAARS